MVNIFHNIYYIMKTVNPKYNITTIQKFINTNFVKKLKLAEFEFSEQSEEFIRKLYNLLLNAETEWLQIVKPSLSNLEVVDMFSNSAYSYIPPEIRKNLESSSKLGYSSYFKINDRTINIKIIFPLESESKIRISNKQYMEKANYMINRIFLWIFIAEKFANHTCSKVINIFLYMSDHIKLLPDKGSSIDRINANTAFTTGCQNNTMIHIFREEEWFKVFIHETFHNLGLDFSNMDQSNLESKILTLFPLKIADIRIYESYCEVWAELINILFNAYWQTVNKKNIDKIIDRMEELMQLERVFSLFQCTKVLQNYNLTYMDIYKSSTHNPNLGKIAHYSAGTSILSYYVIKSILFYNINHFIKWNIIQNNGYTLFFNKTQANMMKYAGLIEELYDLPEYILQMEKMVQLYKDTGRFEYKTLRMSIT